MTAHVVKLASGTTYPITSASWTMSLNGHPAKGYPYPQIGAQKNDTITFTVAPNPHGVTFAANAFCAVPGTNKPTPSQTCSADFSQSGGSNVLIVTDNAPPQTYYYVVKFNKDHAGNAVGPLDPIIINNRSVGMNVWSPATMAEVAAIALLVILIAFLAWRRFGPRP